MQENCHITLSVIAFLVFFGCTYDMYCYIKLQKCGFPFPSYLILFSIFRKLFTVKTCQKLDSHFHRPIVLTTTPRIVLQILIKLTGVYKRKISTQTYHNMNKNQWYFLYHFAQKSNPTIPNNRFIVSFHSVIMFT